MRDTDKKIVDYEKLRKDQMKNLDSLYENIDSKLFDEEGLKSEVKEYMKVSKNYKKQYKENVEKVAKTSKNKQLDNSW